MYMANSSFYFIGLSILGLFIFLPCPTSYIYGYNNSIINRKVTKGHREHVHNPHRMVVDNGPEKALNNGKNVLLIMLDDLNDFLGAFEGHPQVITPNIDRLAEKGVVFSNASATSPICNPSRTALLTGRRAHETGIMSNDEGYFREFSEEWVTKLTTLPQYMGQNGYETVGQGKLFHYHSHSRGEFQTVGPGGAGCPEGPDIERVPGTNLEWSESDARLEESGDWKSANYGVSFLQESHDKPFFLGIGIFRPHLPWHAPKEYFDLLPPVDDIILPPYLENDLEDTFGESNMALEEVLKQGQTRRWKETVRAYLASIMFADACVGHLLDALEQSSYAENTLVVLVSDNGFHVGEKEHIHKFTMWERSVKAPMIMYDPIDGQSGVCEVAVSHQDIYPTILDLTGVTTPEFPVRGRSLKPLIQNLQANWCGAALSTHKGHHSFRSNRYRYIRYKNGREELYDHQVDPNEWTNVAKDAGYNEILIEHQEAMDEMLNHNENPTLSDCSYNPIVPISKVAAKLKIFMEGFLKVDTSEMHNILAQKNLLPSLQPFNYTPFSYDGEETISEVTDRLTDWVLVELRSKDDPSQVIQRKAALIDVDGIVHDTDQEETVEFENVDEGAYYIAIYQKSHLAILSGVPVNLTADNPTFYDFTSSLQSAYGNEQLVNIGGKYAMISGDFDHNGVVNNKDFNSWSTQAAKLNEYLSVDADGNGIINNLDFNLWYKRNSKIGDPILSKE